MGVCLYKKFEKTSDRFNLLYSLYVLRETLKKDNLFDKNFGSLPFKYLLQAAPDDKQLGPEDDVVDKAPTPSRKKSARKLSSPIQEEEPKESEVETILKYLNIFISTLKCTRKLVRSIFNESRLELDFSSSRSTRLV